MKLIRNILVESGPTLNLRRHGFVIAPEQNFRDDGTSFKGYYYDPEKKGDKRFITSKAVVDNEVYISVTYTDEETGKTTYFDDLNGVSYQYAIDHIEDLSKKINEFKAKLDAGEIKPIELSDEDIINIKAKAKQLMELTDENHYSALNIILKKLNIDKNSLRTEVRNKLYKDFEAEVRNSREDDPIIVKALAKRMLRHVMFLMKGTKGRYNSRGKWEQGIPAYSLEDALKSSASINTYSFDDNAKEYVDMGLEPSKTYYLDDLNDANQEKIRNWVRNKIETLYDFE